MYILVYIYSSLDITECEVCTGKLSIYLRFTFNHFDSPNQQTGQLTMISNVKNTMFFKNNIIEILVSIHKHTRVSLISKIGLERATNCCDEPGWKHRIIRYRMRALSRDMGPI